MDLRDLDPEFRYAADEGREAATTPLLREPESGHSCDRP